MKPRSTLHFRKNPLSVAICSLAASQLMFGDAAVAQEQLVLEEVIVTARKRDESAKDVPVSITAMGANAIEDAGVDDITELFALSPGVENNADGSRIANKPTIRGVGSTENASIRAKVTSFIDGIPMVGAQGIGSFAGLQQVEILRGPQSAAFGRSTFGGAINYVTRDPGDELAINLRTTFGNDGARRISGLLSTPIVENKVGLLVTLEEKNYDGDGDWETTSGDQLGGTNDKLGSIKLTFDVADSLSGEIMYIRQEVDDDPPPVLFANLDQLQPHPDDPDGQCAINGGGNSCVIRGEVDSIPLVFDYDYDNQQNPILDPGTDITRDRVQGSLSMDFANGWSLTALAAYTEEEGFTWFDRDTFNGGAAIHVASSPESDESYGEIRLASSAENRLSWLVGASIYDYDYVNTVYTNFTTGVIMDLFSEGATNIGAFFNLSYQVSDRLTASLEGRYQDDQISGTYPAAPARGVPADLTDESTTTSFQPRFALTYALNDENNVYVQVARGTNPAGFNTIALDPILLSTAEEEAYDLDAFQTFDEEEIVSYEIGFKGELSAHGLRYAASVYYLDWTGYVSPVTGNWTPTDGVLLPGTTDNDYFTRLFVNTGDLDGFGAEFEGMWVPTERLQLGTALAYSGLEFAGGSCSPIPLDYGVPAIQTDPFACASIEGAVPPMVSEFTAALNATYTVQFAGDKEGYARLDYQYRAKRYTEQINTDYLPAYDLVNLRLGVRADSWSAELFAENLLDDDTPVGAVRFFDNRQPGMVFNTSVMQRRPRSVGISLAYNF